MGKFSTYTDSILVDGDADTGLMRDDSASATIEVPAKHLTGGMIAHNGAVKAFYQKNHVTADGVKNYKIANLADTGLSSGTIRIQARIDFTADRSATIDIIINNRTALTERIVSISAENTTNIADYGIRTYVEADTSLSIYMYFAGTNNGGLSVDLTHTGYQTLSAATITPPNSITSTTPTGTLSLDTTAGKYANGVPDGNEDWVNLTLAASYAGVCRYRRHANGLVEVQAELTALGTTTDGTAIVTTALPAGYRPVSYNQNIPLTGTISSGSCGRIKIDTAGTIKIYSYATATANWGFTTTYMAEA